MEFLIAIVIAIFAAPVVAALHRRTRVHAQQKLSAGGHLVLTDLALTPERIRTALYRDDPTLAPGYAERTLRDAEVAHLAAEVARMATRAGDTSSDEKRTDQFRAREFTITFKPDEPTTFATFTGQEHLVRPLRAAIAALEPTHRVITHKLFTGLPGRGKTLLAKVIGRELQLRAETSGLAPVAFFETFASNLDTIADLDAVANALLANDGGVWFIDEIHVLKHDLSTKIFALMEDQKYPFHGSVTPTPMPDVMLIGATTDYGKLHPALKRRFGEPMMVRPMSKQELLALVTTRRFPITADAAQLLVERTHWSGAPYEAIGLRNEAEVFARARQSKHITLADVEEVFAVYEIDAMGLRWMDREILRALFKVPRFKRGGAEFVCYGASERDVCGMAGLDPEEYRESIKPRLMSRRLVEVRAGYGQALSAHGQDVYEYLKAS